MKKQLSSTLAKAREVYNAKKCCITGVAQPEATSLHSVEELTQSKASGYHIMEEVAHAGAPSSLSHLAAAHFPLNDMPVPGTQLQVEFLALELSPSIIIHVFFVFVRQERLISTDL